MSEAVNAIAKGILKRARTLGADQIRREKFSAYRNGEEYEICSDKTFKQVEYEDWTPATEAIAKVAELPEKARQRAAMKEAKEIVDCLKPI